MDSVVYGTRRRARQARQVRLTGYLPCVLRQVWMMDTSLGDIRAVGLVENGAGKGVNSTSALALPSEAQTFVCNQRQPLPTWAALLAWLS